MSPQQFWLWKIIRISPQKWLEKSYGEPGGGFWVVAIFGCTVIWYNDIEDGFNRSTYSEFGVLDEYVCNQDALEWTIQHLLNDVGTVDDPTSPEN
ncbi:hypothetical protein AAKU55_005339 [Oxalobacteraceae bacterium GrIS 1.11]